MGGRQLAFEVERPRVRPGRVVLLVALVAALVAPAAGAGEANAIGARVAAVPTIDTGTLVRTTATSAWIPGSPDPSGVVWMPGPDRLVVVDSEVDEPTGAGVPDPVSNNVNIWFTQRDGTVTGTGTTWGSTAAMSGYSLEPTGVGFNPAGNVLFISDDAEGVVFVIRTGPDSQFGNADDVVTTVDTAALGDVDTEDPVYDPVSGDLLFLDGMGTEVYRVAPVDGTFGNGNDTVTHFDISHLNPLATDFEGMARDPSRGTLYIGSRTTRQIFEVGLDGTHLRTINIAGIVDGITPLRSVSGLAVAPSSTGPGSNLFIADRAIDNGADATENDGRLWEVTAPDVGGPVATAPGAPTIGTAAMGNGAATVSWTAPVSDGGSPIYGYVVTPYIGAVAQTSARFYSAATTQTITGLTNGTSYTFRVAALNGMGIGPRSAASNVVVPDVAPPRHFLTQDHNGSAEVSFAFGLPSDAVVYGDWNGDGVDTIGVRRGATWYLRNSNSTGPSNMVFSYGLASDKPIVGDWNGDGVDTIGVRRGATVYLRNSNSGGLTNVSYSFGLASDKLIVGDWDGNGQDTLGLRRGSKFMLRNVQSAGAANVVFSFGLASDVVLDGGNWDGVGGDTIGVRRGNVFLLRNVNSGGPANVVYGFGTSADVPHVGDWNDDGQDTAGVSRNI